MSQHDHIAHLLAVQEIQKEGKTGPWVAMGITKAFDTVSHPMLEAFLSYAGLPQRWGAVVTGVLKVHWDS